MGRRTPGVFYLVFATLWGVCACGFGVSFASKSANYQLIETSLGGTGLVNSTSPDFMVQESGGIIGLGTSTGTSYQVKAGNQTTSNPSLAFAILSANPSFGTFSPTSTATATAQFEVLDYTSYGYEVQITGTPPTDPYGNKITPLSTNAGPSVGKDQFGLNLVANTSPTNFGAGPNYGQFGYGSVATNYNTPNSYRFVNGDEIASSGKSSGTTVYTISYIVNVNDLTQGGQYTSLQSLICTGTY